MLTENQIQILQFLSNQRNPVDAEDFPKEIKINYNSGLGRDSIYHELMIMKEKDLVSEFGARHYQISDFGLQCIHKEIDHFENMRVSVLRELKSKQQGQHQPIDKIMEAAGVPLNFRTAIQKSLRDDGLIRCYKGVPQECVLDDKGELYLAKIDLNHKQTKTTPVMNIQNQINNDGIYIEKQKIDNNGNLSFGNKNQLDFREALPAWNPNKNTKAEEIATNHTEGLLMKFWKLISHNPLISAILSALIVAAIYYFIFGITPKIG